MNRINNNCSNPCNYFYIDYGIDRRYCNYISDDSSCNITTVPIIIRVKIKRY